MQSTALSESVLKAVAHVHKKAGAVATGSWQYENNRLFLEHFQACPEVKPEVATGFPKATADVPVTDTGLGIVLAARARQTTQYRAIDLPPETGSGYWIRAFEADRSIAVPQFDGEGRLKRILSVAVRGLQTPADYYERIVLEAFELYLNGPGRAMPDRAS